MDCSQTDEIHSRQSDLHGIVVRREGKSRPAFRFCEKLNLRSSWWSPGLPLAQKASVSIHVCCYNRKTTHNFVVINDDVCHGSAQTSFAIKKVQDWLHGNDPVHSQVAHVSDGAASRFTNRYQLHEFRKLRYPAGKLVCFPQLDMIKTHLMALEDLQNMRLLYTIYVSQQQRNTKCEGYVQGTVRIWKVPGWCTSTKVNY